MFEQPRSPIQISVQYPSFTCRFFRFDSESADNGPLTKANLDRIDALDRLTSEYAFAIGSKKAVDSINRELAYAHNVAEYAANGVYPTMNATMKADSFNAFAGVRVFLEAIVRAQAILWSPQPRRIELLGIYENAFRDHQAARRNWTAPFSSNDTVPERLGKSLSNLSKEQFAQLRPSSYRFRTLGSEPSKRENEQKTRDTEFRKQLEVCKYPFGRANQFWGWTNSWHSLASSFSHADPFAVSMLNSFSSRQREFQIEHRAIIVDIIELVARHFVSFATKLLDELSMADFLPQSPEKAELLLSDSSYRSIADQ